MMGLAEWIGLKSYLQENRIMEYKERATFALIPSLTSIRKVLFTGVISMDQMKQNQRVSLGQSNFIFHGAKMPIKAIY